MKNKINSIGVLNGVNNSYILTPVFKGNSLPVKVRITATEFSQIRGNTDLMKEMAASKLTSLTK